MHGQSRRGVAVDCVRFVAGVLDELYRVSSDVDAVPVLPPDASWHDPRGVVRVARALSGRYPGVRITGAALTVEPGDVLIMRTSQAAESPGHVAIVGARENTMWHANPGSGVTEAGIGEARNVVRAWRMKGKEQWLR